MARKTGKVTRKELEDLIKVIDGIKGRLDNLFKTTEELGTRLEKLEGQLESLEKIPDIQELQERVSSEVMSKLDLDSIKTELQELRTEHDNLKSLREDLTGLISELESTRNELQTMTDEHSQFKEQLSNLQEIANNLQEIANRVADLELSLQSFETGLRRLDTLEEQLNNMMDNLTSYTSNISSIELKLSEISVELDELKGKLLKLGDLSKLSQDIEELRTLTENLSSNQDYINSNIDKYEERLNELERQINSKYAELEGKLATIEGLSERLDELETPISLEEFESKLETVKADIENLRDELVNLQQELNTVKSDFEDIHKKISDREFLQAMVDSIQDEKLADIFERLKALEERIPTEDELLAMVDKETIKQTIDEYQNQKIQELEEKLQEVLNRQRSTLQEMIDEAQDQQIRELEERLKALEERLSRETIDKVKSEIDTLQDAKINAINVRLDELSKRVDDLASMITVSSRGGEQQVIPEEEEIEPSKDLKIDTYILLEKVMLREDIDATDLHIKPGNRPIVRVNGQLIPVGKYVLSASDAYKLVLDILKPRHLRKLKKDGVVDFSFEYKGNRFRVNAFRQYNGYGAAIRKIKSKVGSFEELNLPKFLENLCRLPNGLVIISGPTGSGKSTTIAAMIEYINRNFAKRIITIEDPIEYVFEDKESVISQREVGIDTPSYFEGLKAALREDPDVIFIGELRDPETTWVATTAAETGHLVLTTLHSSDTIQSIHRLFDMFTGEQKVQFRSLLAASLKAIMAQKLLRRADGKGLVPAVEIMVMTPTIRSLIKESAVDEIYDYIVEGEIDGMQTFSDSLASLVEKGLITREEALAYAEHPEEVQRKLTESTLTSRGHLEF